MFSERTTLQKLLLLKALSGDGQSLVERTALGNPLTFGTDVSKPLKSLLIPFTPVQSGTGDPSPENIRSILPWNGLTVFGGGKNLLKYPTGQTKQNNGVNYAILSDGGQSCEGTATATSYAIDSLRTVLHAGMYTVSVSGAVNMKTVIVKNGAYFRQIAGNGQSTFSITEDTEIGCYSFANNGDTVDETIYVHLEVGQTASAYEPFVPITETDISFPSPVYGGTLDVVSGVLTVEWVGKSATWGEIKTGSPDPTSEMVAGYVVFDDPILVAGKGATASNTFCNVGKWLWEGIGQATPHFYAGTTNSGTVYRCNVYMPDGTDDNMQVVCVCKLVEPQEITLTPEQITALVGNNTIWSDSDGSMTAVYLVSAAYADSHPVGGLGSGLLGGGFGSGSGEPDEPSEPDEPGEPDDDTGDDQPDEPAEPDQPDEPAEPDQPEEP